jgi:hypothetical protein
MDHSPQPTGPDVNRLIVPEDLLKKVSDARERFHAAKATLETAMDDTDYDHGRHVDDRYTELRNAERELEELTQQVQEILARKV